MYLFEILGKLGNKDLRIVHARNTCISEIGVFTYVLVLLLLLPLPASHLNDDGHCQAGTARIQPLPLESC